MRWIRRTLGSLICSRIKQVVKIALEPSMKLMSHRTRGGVPPLRARILAVVLLFSPLFGIAQSIDTSKVATVHVYRKGRLLTGVSLSADGTKIASLSPHKIVTFYLFPGYHELTLQSGEISPSALFKAEPGGEYFFRLDYEHVISATSLRGLSLSLSMQTKAFDKVTRK
jgi:hypothetical protein